MVEQLFSAFHHAQKAKKSDESAAASAASAKSDMETTKSYMETTEGYMTTTEGYMTTTQSYMDTTEAAVVKLEEVDTVVANAKVEITELSASEQTNIQNTAAASRDAAVTTINETRDAAVITVNETRDAAVDTVNSTKDSSVITVNETREAAIASIEEKADSYADKNYVEGAITDLQNSAYGPPDYTKGVAISSGYVVTAKGWIIFESSSGGGFQSPRVYIDGITIYAPTNLDGTRWSGIAPVKVGQKITFSAVNSAVFYAC